MGAQQADASWRAAPAQQLLAALCVDLRQLWTQAGGPSLRVLETQIQVSKSQVGAILNGRIRRPPDWRVVSGLIQAVHRYATDAGRMDRVSLRTGIEEYWRPRYAALEHAFGSQSTWDLGEDGSAADAAAGPAPAMPIRPCLLPSAVAGFTGRADALRSLDGLRAADGSDEVAAPIAVICGTAGVGKTALAVHWARRVASEFPDGQLYVNLRGFDPVDAPMDPVTAVRLFLDALGMTVHRIPSGADAMVGLLRSLLAGRRVLVVLDNAHDVDQVRPMLASSAGCLTVVTSRNLLDGLVVTEGAHLVRLDVFTPAESHTLLTRRIGAGRVEAEPEAVGDIIAGCAGLPLALAVAAARAVAQPHFPLTAVATGLRGAATALDELRLGEAAADVRAVFTWSYRRLGTEPARLFRLLGLHPGPDITVAAAASLAGVTVHQARTWLVDLVRAHLVSEPTPGRYGLHDLVRTYAIEQLGTTETPPERDGAVRRLLDHYLHTALPAAHLLERRPDQIDIPEPEDGATTTPVATTAEAQAWFTQERLVLLNAVGYAVEEGRDAHAWRLAWALTPFLHQHGYWADQLAVHRSALDAARRLADPVAQGHMHRGIARGLAQLGRPDDGYAASTRALRLFEEAGDRIAQARTHLCLAWLAERRQRVTDALDHARRALALGAGNGHPTGQVRALYAVGWYQALSGDYRGSLIRCRQALDLARELGESDVQAWALDSLGYAHQHLGHHREAIQCYRGAVALTETTDDACSRAEILVRLGQVQLAAGQRDAASASWQRAVDTFDALGHADAERVRAILASARISEPARSTGAG